MGKTFHFSIRMSILSVRVTIELYVLISDVILTSSSVYSCTLICRALFYHYTLQQHKSASQTKQNPNKIAKSRVNST